MADEILKGYSIPAFFRLMRKWRGRKIRFIATTSICMSCWTIWTGRAAGETLRECTNEDLYYSSLYEDSPIYTDFGQALSVFFGNYGIELNDTVKGYKSVSDGYGNIESIFSDQNDMALIFEFTNVMTSYEFNVADITQQAEFLATLSTENSLLEKNGSKTSMYQAYYDKLMDIQSLYGEACMLEYDEFETWLMGLCFAKLLDFNQDGQEELVVAYCTGVDNDWPNYNLEVWRYKNKDLELVFKGNCWMNEELYASVNILSYENQFYLCQPISGIEDYSPWWGPNTFVGVGGENYWRYQEDSFMPVHSLSYYWDENSGQQVHQVDGASVTEEAYYQTWETYLENTERFWLTYSAEQAANELGKTKATVEATRETLQEVLGIVMEEPWIPEETAQVDAEILYADILDLFYYSITSEWENYKGYGYEYVSDIFPRHQNSSSNINRIGYSFVDLDGHGVPELLIGMNEDGENKGNTIYDLYTYVNGSFVHLASSGERYYYELCADHTIYYYGSGGAVAQTFYHYCLNSGENTLTVMESVYSTNDYDFENIYWYYETTEWFDEEIYEKDYSKMTQISESEAYEIMDAWPQTVDFELIMFDSYTPQGDNLSWPSVMD